MSFKVVGVNFENEDGTKRQALLGELYDNHYGTVRQHAMRFRLEPEDDNPEDRQAVGVYCDAPAEAAGRLGFVPRELAPKVREALRRDLIGSIELHQMTLGSNGVVGLQLKIMQA